MKDVSRYLSGDVGSPLRAYFTNALQLADILEYMLSVTGPANVIVSTFSTSEEFLRRLFRLREAGTVTSAQLYCDCRAARKLLLLADFMSNVFDEVRLCENHSKVLLVCNERHSLALLTSQNQTRGDRYEAGVISADPALFDFLCNSISDLNVNSTSISDILRQS